MTTQTPGERLKALVELELSYLTKLEKLEEDAKEIKGHIDRIARTDLPELLKELGMTEATLADIGIKITLSNGVDISMPEATRDKAFEWLVEKGHGAIVRSEVTVVFGAEELEKAEAAAEGLRAMEYTPLVKMSVPPPTLKAWAKEVRGKGEDIPPEFFNLHAYDIAKLTVIKPKKGKN